MWSAWYTPLNINLLIILLYEYPENRCICAGMLNENGIPAAVFGENSSYISLNYIDELEVKVNPEDYDQAMALINQKD